MFVFFFELKVDFFPIIRKNEIPNFPYITRLIPRELHLNRLFAKSEKRFFTQELIIIKGSLSFLPILSNTNVSVDQKKRKVGGNFTVLFFLAGFWKKTNGTFFHQRNASIQFVTRSGK